MTFTWIVSARAHENAKTSDKTTVCLTRSTHNAGSIWCIASLYSKTSVFVPTSTFKREAGFSKIFGDRFWKPAFFGPRKRLLRVEGRLKRIKKSPFSKIYGFVCNVTGLLPLSVASVARGKIQQKFPNFVL